jgi:hypothetical protein
MLERLLKKKPGLHRQEILTQSAYPRLSIQDPGENRWQKRVQNRIDMNLFFPFLFCNFMLDKD